MIVVPHVVIVVPFVVIIVPYKVIIVPYEVIIVPYKVIVVPQVVICFLIIQLGKGSKIKLIIFAEFSAKGYPPPRKSNQFFPDIFFKKNFIGLK